MKAKRSIFAVFLAVILTVNILYSNHIKAEAMATGAAVTIAVAGGAVTTAELLAVPEVINTIIIGGAAAYAGLDIYVGEQAAADGLTKSEWLYGKWSDFVDAAGYPIEQAAGALVNGAKIAKDGTITLAGSAWDMISNFLDWAQTENLVLFDATPSSIDFGGVPMYSLSAGGTSTIGVQILRDGSTVPIILENDSSVDVLFGVNYPYTNQSYRIYFFFASESPVTFKVLSSSETRTYAFQDSETYYRFNYISDLFGNYYGVSLSSSSSTSLSISASQISSLNGRDAWLNIASATETDGTYAGLIGNYSAARTAMDNVAVGEDEKLSLRYKDFLDALQEAIDEALDLPTDVVLDPALPDVAIPDVIDAPPIVDVIPDTDVADDATDIVVPEEPVIDTASLEDTAGILGDLVNWALDYISPTKGILSKFPFSIPYDLYLLVGAFAGDSADAINANPSGVSIQNDLDAPSSKYSNYGTNSSLVFDNEFTFHFGDSAVTVPINIDLSPFQWLFRIIRTGTGALYLAGLLMWTRQEAD